MSNSQKFSSTRQRGLLQFSLRGVMLGVLIAGISAGWWADRRRLVTDKEDAEQRLRTVEGAAKHRLLEEIDGQNALGRHIHSIDGFVELADFHTNDTTNWEPYELLLDEARQEYGTDATIRVCYFDMPGSEEGELDHFTVFTANNRIFFVEALSPLS